MRVDGIAAPYVLAGKGRCGTAIVLICASLAASVLIGGQTPHTRAASGSTRRSLPPAAREEGRTLMSIDPRTLGSMSTHLDGDRGRVKSRDATFRYMANKARIAGHTKATVQDVAGRVDDDNSAVVW